MPKLKMDGFVKGLYRAVVAKSVDDVSLAQNLRGVCFDLSGPDVDSFDGHCIHVLIRRIEDDHIVACFRMLPVDGSTIGSSYSAQYYDLKALANFDGRMVELGRFCIHPDEKDPDILRVAWAAMTTYVDENNVKLLFGCSSFAGIETLKFRAAFAALHERHLAPTQWLPSVKAPNVFKFSSKMDHEPNHKEAMSQMPPLLRTYLLMGGWVSDHAVIDSELNTMHVFTGVEIDAIPAARKRLLRAVVGD